MATRTRPSPEVGTPGLAVAAVARRLGVAPATLRTWDRRYGLGPSEHEAGAHRRYTRQDVERLLVMRRLTLDGVAPGDAARAARGVDAATAGRLVDPVRTPSAVVEAALAGDRVRLAALLELRGGDVVDWWTELVGPARELLAVRTLLDRPGFDADLALQRAVTDAVRAATEDAHRHPSGGVVLLGSPPGAPRALLLHVIAAAVGEAEPRLLAGPLSARHLVELAAMTRARALITVAERTGDDLGLVAAVSTQLPDLPQLVLVPPHDFGRIPTGPAVQRARSVGGLIHELRALLVAGGNETR